MPDQTKDDNKKEDDELWFQKAQPCTKIYSQSENPLRFQD